MSPEDTMRPTVLFVGERGDLEALRATLHAEPYRIVVAGTGEEALAQLAVHDSVVVVCGEELPDMAGSVLLSIVRRRLPETMRIMLTSHAALRAINDGDVFRFLPEPCARIDLTQAIRDALEAHDLHEVWADDEITEVICRGALSAS
jgi:DNA-binding NtrC family response regulator